MDNSILCERWLPVVGYEGWFEVSDLGRIRSIARTVAFVNGRSCHYRSKIKNLNPCGPQGYVLVCLSRERKNHTYRVHRLVLEAFVGAAPEGTECRHLNGNPADNRLVNLAWGTHSENNIDKIRHGTDPNAAKVDCLRGHLLCDPNLARLAARPTRRDCLACYKAKGRFYRLRRRGIPCDMQSISDAYYAEIMKNVA